MLLPDQVAFPTGDMAVGSHMFGYANGLVILPNMQLKDSADVSRSLIVNSGILTFDPYWARPVNKSYVFAKVCYDTFNLFQAIFDRDIGHVTRLWTPDWIEYGFVDPDSSSFIHNIGSVDINLNMVSVYERSLRV